MNDSTTKIKNIEMMVEFSPIKDYLEGFLSSKLLFLGFTTMNTILGLELLKKTSLLDHKFPTANIFVQCH
jgi:hypothetical protein